MEGRRYKGIKKKVVLIISTAVVFLALIGTIVVLATRKPAEIQQGEQNTNSTEESKRSVLITEDNIEEVIANNQPKESETSADRYTVTMNTYWSFPDGKSASANAYVGNATDNTHAVYFDIYIVENGETIYESPVIPVGTHIDKIKLDKELDDGIYDCIMEYHLVDDDQNTLSTVDVSLTISIGDNRLR